MTDSSDPRFAPGTRSSTEPVRDFVDGDGIRWRVYEIAFSDYDRRRGLSLIFASDVAVRRVRNYPANWATLPDEALAALSWEI
jgi:hypothetical protein